MEPIVPDACGQSVPLPDHTDRLRAAWSNPEDYRERQLVTFADAERAQAYAARVADLFGSCPEEVTSEEMGESRHTTVADSDLGDWSAAASVLYHQQGYPEVVDAMHTLNGDYPSEPPFGPDGFGQVTLGMSREALLAVPGVRFTGDNGVCEDFEAPGVRGHLQPGLGVAVLLLSNHADLETPEQVHLGSPLAEVRAAYPHGEYDDPWYSQPPYRFELGEDDRVISLMLLLDDQHCGS